MRCHQPRPSYHDHKGCSSVILRQWCRAVTRIPIILVMGLISVTGWSFASVTYNTVPILDQYLIFSSSPYDFWSLHIGRFWYLYVLSGSASHVVARHLIYQNGSSVICSILWLNWDTWMTKMSIFLIMCVFKVYKNYHHYNFSIQHDIHYIFHQHIKKN